VAKNVIGTRYDELYGPTGPLGWPVTEQFCADNGVCYQRFAGGTITTSAATGTQVVWGGIAQFWAQSGGPYGLGAAVASMESYSQPNGLGWIQRFQGGAIGQSASGTFIVPRNSIGTAWLASGSGQGPYGWPTGIHACVNSSCAQTFQGAVLSATASNGNHPIMWGFQAYWAQNGGLSTLGAAVTDLRGSNASGGGWVQQFAAAALTMRINGTMTQIPYGPLWSAWVASGAESGNYGWPESASACSGSECGQRFQTAVITNSPNGTFAVIGGFVGPWDTFGGIATVGAATAPLRYAAASRGGWSQQYSRGVITQSRAGTPIFTPASPILNTWQHYGAEATWLGWPVEAQQCNAESCTQRFQHGVASSVGIAVSFTAN